MVHTQQRKNRSITIEVAREKGLECYSEGNRRGQKKVMNHMKASWSRILKQVGVREEPWGGIVFPNVEFVKHFIVGTVSILYPSPQNKSFQEVANGPENLFVCGLKQIKRFDAEIRRLKGDVAKLKKQNGRLKREVAELKKPAEMLLSLSN